MLYSKSTNGFYDPAINGDIPKDAVEITVDQWQSLMDAQSSGKVIQSDVNGNPEATNPPGPTQAQTINIISRAIQVALDAGAKNWGYDSIVSAASYAASTNKQYAADSATLIGWRDSVWSWATPLFSSVVAGESPDEFMKKMPAQPAQPKVS